MVLKKDDGQEQGQNKAAAAPAPAEGSMTVRMKQQMSGTRDGKDWPAPGEKIDLPADEAVSLLAGGVAEQVEDDGSDVETATAPKATTRGKP